MRSDARVYLYFLPASEGGRLTPISPGMFHGSAQFPGAPHCFDFRIEVFEELAPGSARELNLAFLCPEDVRPFLEPGATFLVWVGHSIAEGRVLDSNI